jgi:hypothetical protein
MIRDSIHGWPLPAHKPSVALVKPDTRTAMADLIRQIRCAMPFDAPQAALCVEHCSGCSIKLLEFLDSELHDWELRLADGERPNFGDLDRLGKTAKKIYAILRKNGLLE